MIQFSKPHVKPLGLPRQWALSRLVPTVPGARGGGYYHSYPMQGDDPRWVLIMKSSLHQFALEFLGLVNEGSPVSSYFFQIWV